MRDSNRRLILRIYTRLTFLGLSLLAALTTALPVWAQQDPNAPMAPPPGSAPTMHVWKAYIVMGLLFAAVMAVALKPGKRTHQD